MTSSRPPIQPPWSPVLTPGLSLSVRPYLDSDQPPRDLVRTSTPVVLRSTTDIIPSDPSVRMSGVLRGPQSAVFRLRYEYCVPRVEVDEEVETSSVVVVDPPVSLVVPVLVTGREGRELPTSGLDWTFRLSSRSHYSGHTCCWTCRDNSTRFSRTLRSRDEERFRTRLSSLIPLSVTSDSFL